MCVCALVKKKVWHWARSLSFDPRLLGLWLITILPSFDLPKTQDVSWKTMSYNLAFKPLKSHGKKTYPMSCASGKIWKNVVFLAALPSDGWCTANKNSSQMRRCELPSSVATSLFQLDMLWAPGLWFDPVFCGSWLMTILPSSDLPKNKDGRRLKACHLTSHNLAFKPRKVP